jgi:hypothetical protein
LDQAQLRHLLMSNGVALWGLHLRGVGDIALYALTVFRQALLAGCVVCMSVHLGHAKLVPSIGITHQSHGIFLGHQ